MIKILVQKYYTNLVFGEPTIITNKQRNIEVIPTINHYHTLLSLLVPPNNFAETIQINSNIQNKMLHSKVKP